MLFALIGLGLTAWIGAGTPAWLLAPVLPSVTFNPHRRAVSNWRLEGILHLDAAPSVALGLLAGTEPPQVSRCVRLNNYWCIKRAGWAGEIAADTEGHVAFASTAEGADVAALLLRRYYRDYGRHSAFAIVSHWAPAACGPAPLRLGGSRSQTGRSPADHLATRGLVHTLRARFLAAHGRRVAGRGRRRGAVSAVPDRLIGSTTTTPSIVARFGEAPLDLGIRSLAVLPLAALAAPSPPPMAVAEPSCASEEARVRAYAAKATFGIAPTINDDLKLFDAAGTPTVNLGRLMRNMAAVEIGPLGAREALIAAAVEHARRFVAARSAAAPTSPAP